LLVPARSTICTADVGYFHDPSGHLLEIITQPYGSEPQRWQLPTAELTATDRIEEI
jgi:hypothetical protein